MKDILPIQVIKIFNAVTLNNETGYSDPINLQTIANHGMFTLAYEFDTDSHASARVDFGWQVSWDGETWVKSSDLDSDGNAVYEIASDQHEGSGIDSNGKEAMQFTCILAPWMRIYATETETQNAIFDAWVFIQ